jgi:hypothetical protein
MDPAAGFCIIGVEPSDYIIILNIKSAFTSYILNFRRKYFLALNSVSGGKVDMSNTRSQHKNYCTRTSMFSNILFSF